MKVKHLEKEIDKRLKRIIQDLETGVSLYEVYMKEASDKRKIKFEKKLERKYLKAITKLDKRVDKLPW